MKLFATEWLTQKIMSKKAKHKETLLVRYKVK